MDVLTDMVTIKYRILGLVLFLVPFQISNYCVILRPIINTETLSIIILLFLSVTFIFTKHFRSQLLLHGK